MKLTKLIISTVVSLSILVVLALPSIVYGGEARASVQQAAAPARLTYQGHLLDADGNPVADGTYTMAFSLWDAAEGGAQVWGPEEQEVATEDGFFAVVLGATMPLDPASLAAPLYLEIAVEGEVLAPRQELASVAFALVASQAEAAPWSGLSGIPAGFADGVDDVDDAVSWSEISGIVGTGASQVAAGNHIHDDRYYTESELQTSGAAGVHWGNLTSMPAGFADGVDDTGRAAFGPGVPPAAGTLTLLASPGAGSVYVAATVGADGLPIIAYYDATNGDLKVAHCNDVACTGATHSTLDSTGDVGLYTSIALGADGLPVIAYYDNSAGDLKVAHCSNITCTSATLTTMDASGITGQYTSIAIGSDGLPLIAYRDVTNTNLKVVRCPDVACSSSATSYTLDGAGIDVGNYSISLAVGADGLGLIAYFDDTNGDLKVAHCNNTACSTAAVYTLDSSGIVGRHNSLVIGADGLGLIAYRNASAPISLRVAHCDNVLCSSAGIYTLDSTVADPAQFTSAAVGADGLVVISYRQPTNQYLRVARCTNWLCSSAVLNTVDSASAVNGYTSITIGTDGLGLIAYTTAAGEVRLARCANPFCSPYFGRR